MSNAHGILSIGVASAPAMFQKAMGMILQGLPGEICYIDDILVLGRTEEEQFFRLEEVLKRLKNYGLRVKKNKCALISERVRPCCLIRCLWTASIKQQGRSYCSSPRTTECTTVAVILGSTQLLWQIHQEPRHLTTSIKQACTTEC